MSTFQKTGTGPFSSVVFSHGSPRGTFRPTVFYDAQAKWFTDWGYAVVRPHATGYGRSHGNWSEDSGSCYNSDYVKAELATSHDSLAALDYFSGQGFVDPNLFALIEQSEDGLGSAAPDSRKPPGVVGVVNFSGGRGSRGSGSNCSPEHLVDATGHFGRTTTILDIWIHGSEDDFFGSRSRSQCMATSMLRSGAALDSRLIDGLGHVFSRAPRQSRRGGRLSMLFCAMSVGGNDLYSSVILPASHIV